MGAVRLELQLANPQEWLTLFTPREGTLVVETERPVDDGAEVLVDLDVRGWLVTLRGRAVARRESPPAIVVAVARGERDKLNYLYAFVRGALLNHRERRRLPLRLPVTYGAIEGPASTFTKDISEEGIFLLTDRPLPETSQVHMLITVPDRAQPLSIVGKVSHTILAGDEEPPGMGLLFDLDAAQREAVAAVIRDLEARLHAGTLPADALTSLPDEL